MTCQIDGARLDAFLEWLDDRLEDDLDDLYDYHEDEADAARDIRYHLAFVRVLRQARSEEGASVLANAL
jgi:hypothetical protein